MARLQEVRRRRADAKGRKDMEDKAKSEADAREAALGNPDLPRRAGPRRGKNKKKKKGKK